MNLSRLFIIILIFSQIIYGCSGCPGEGTISTVIAGNMIKSALNQVNGIINNATLSADFLLEKNARNMDLMLKNHEKILADEIQSGKDYISKELAENIRKIEQMVVSLQGGILKLEDFIALDAQNLINQLPFKKDVYAIRRIVGYSQYYRTHGSYPFELVGGAFGPTAKVRIEVNGASVDANNIISNEIYNLKFEVPHNLLENLFSNSKVNRVPVKVTVFSDKNKEVFSHSWNTLLLPIYPIEYNLIEHGAVPEFAEQTSPKEGSGYLGPTGENGRWIETYITIQLEEDEEVIRTEGRTSGSHTHISEVERRPNYTKWIFKNQCHDCGRYGYVLAYYKKRVWKDSDYVAKFENTTDNLLKYGSHIARFSERGKSFTLHLTYFNGRKETIIPGSIVPSDIKITNEQQNTFKRLLLEIKAPN